MNGNDPITEDPEILSIVERLLRLKTALHQPTQTLINSAQNTYTEESTELKNFNTPDPKNWTRWGNWDNSWVNWTNFKNFDKWDNGC
jgi:hypothetical protein